VTFQAFFRYIDDNNYYLIEWVSDSDLTFDNTLTLYKVVAGVKTGVGSSIDYATTLDLTKRWRMTVDVSEAVSPTAITATVRNVTDSTDLSPSLSENDSTAALQVSGGLGLGAFYGTSFYDNVVFSDKYNPGPVLSTQPIVEAFGSQFKISWTAADGGAGTITYTPQYVTLDGFNLPTTTWTNASGTTSTSATVTPSTGGVHAVRIKATDGSGVITYSPWKQASLAYVRMGRNFRMKAA
jgi:hypothetical protein